MRSGLAASTTRTFQLRMRSAATESAAMSSASSSSNPALAPAKMPSRVVPSCSPTTAASDSSSSRSAPLAGTGRPSPSLWYSETSIERPRAPWASEASSRARTRSSSAGVEGRPLASAPMAMRRSVEWPTRKPAFTARRPSRASR